MSDTTRFDLSISTTDTPNRSASVSSDDLDDVMRLMQLAGSGDSPRRFTATVSKTASDPADNATMTVNSSDSDDVLRLLQLAGVIAPPKACGCSGPCDCDSAAPEKSCGCPTPCDCASEPTGAVEIPVVMMEQQAEYDFGHRDPTDEQLEFDIKDYNFKGRADLPERLTSARFGSNALKSEMRESVHERLVKAYKLFINEAEEARENEDGRSSPLTSAKRDEFIKDPFTTEPKTDGSESPLSTIIRQPIPR